LAGPFLAGDVCTRLLRQQGHDAILLCYSDDYQSYLLRKSRETDRSVKDIAFGNAAAIVSSLRSVDIDLSHFLQALDNKYFIDEVNRYFSLVEAAGEVVQRKASVPYCDDCRVWGYEGFGRATCNHCGSPSDASQCEACAGVPDLPKMGTMHCVLCKAPMEYQPIERLSWTIGKRYDRLRERYRNGNHRAALTDFLRKTLASDDDEWPLTRPGEDAIPLERRSGQPIHTWFSGLAGYRATLREYLDSNGSTERIEQWWNNDTELVEFLGFDCSYSHSVAYTALIDLEQSGPRRLHHFTNRFLKLDGEDFSTSRNHAIWVRDIVSAYPPDAVRFYTALKSPENEVDNFSRSQFETWFKEFYVARVLQGSWRSSGSANGASPPAADAYMPLVEAWKHARALETFSISNLAATLMQASDLIEQSKASERNHLWALYGAMGEAIHPAMSSGIRDAVRQHSGETEKWVTSVLTEG
jgi:methionyl-tRNA synthetase